MHTCMYVWHACHASAALCTHVLRMCVCTVPPECAVACTQSPFPASSPLTSQYIHIHLTKAVTCLCHFVKSKVGKLSASFPSEIELQLQPPVRLTASMHRQLALHASWLNRPTAPRPVDEELNRLTMAICARGSDTTPRPGAACIALSTRSPRGVLNLAPSLAAENNTPWASTVLSTTNSSAVSSGSPDRFSLG